MKLAQQLTAIWLLAICAVAQVSAQSNRFYEPLENLDGDCTGDRCGSYWLHFPMGDDAEYGVQAIREALFWALPGTELVSCKDFARLSVGTARGNNSYGASCQLKWGERVINHTVCADNLVGHFALTHDFLGKTDLAKFVLIHCTGG